MSAEAKKAKDEPVEAKHEPVTSFSVRAQNPVAPLPAPEGPPILQEQHFYAHGQALHAACCSNELDTSVSVRIFVVRSRASHLSVHDHHMSRV
jgi:hypothetical protein